MTMNDSPYWIRFLVLGGIAFAIFGGLGRLNDPIENNPDWGDQTYVVDVGPGKNVGRVETTTP